MKLRLAGSMLADTFSKRKPMYLMNNGFGPITTLVPRHTTCVVQTLTTFLIINLRTNQPYADSQRLGKTI